MASDSPQSTLGSIIRKQRELAAFPMRQFAKAVGISNPYLSQIERGLRAPSEAVLSAIAASLQTSADDLYAQAGFVEPDDDEHEDEPSDLLSAIDAATELTGPQRKAMVLIYQSFVDANTVHRVRKPRA